MHTLHIYALGPNCNFTSILNLGTVSGGVSFHLGNNCSTVVCTRLCQSEETPIDASLISAVSISGVASPIVVVITVGASICAADCTGSFASVSIDERSSLSLPRCITFVEYSSQSLYSYMGKGPWCSRTRKWHRVRTIGLGWGHYWTRMSANACNSAFFCS